MFQVIANVETILTPILVIVVAAAPAIWRRCQKNRYSGLEKDVLSFLAQGHLLKDISPRSFVVGDVISVAPDRPAHTTNISLTVDDAIHSLIRKNVLLKGGSTSIFASYSCLLSAKGEKHLSKNKKQLVDRGYKKLKVELPDDD